MTDTGRPLTAKEQLLREIQDRLNSTSIDTDLEVRSVKQALRDLITIMLVEEGIVADYANGRP